MCEGISAGSDTVTVKDVNIDTNADAWIVPTDTEPETEKDKARDRIQGSRHTKNLWLDRVSLEPRTRACKRRDVVHSHRHKSSNKIEQIQSHRNGKDTFKYMRTGGITKASCYAHTVICMYRYTHKHRSK